MTTDLLTLLQRAAQALPDRFRVDADHDGYLTALTPYELSGLWRRVHTLPPSHSKVLPDGLLYIEAACRSECDARGWAWEVGALIEGTEGEMFSASIHNRAYWEWRDGLYEVTLGPTPAAALLTALLNALEEHA